MSVRSDIRVSTDFARRVWFSVPRHALSFSEDMWWMDGAS